MNNGRYHCDACGWDGEMPVRHEEPFLFGTWLEWRCPDCGEEVYAVVVLRDPQRPTERN